MCGAKTLCSGVFVVPKCNFALLLQNVEFGISEVMHFGLFLGVFGSFLCSLQPARQPPSHPLSHASHLPSQPCTQPASTQAAMRPDTPPQTYPQKHHTNISQNTPPDRANSYFKFMHQCSQICVTLKYRGSGSQVTRGNKVEFEAAFDAGLRE